MKCLRTLALVVGLCVWGAAAPMGGCEKKSDSPKPPAPSAGAGGHDRKSGDDHGATTQLGERAAGGFTIRASRDGGIKPGGEAPIDVWVTGGSGRIAAVRFWIGAEDAKGSVKARASLEKDNWHTHVEVPRPLPDGSRLWVEVETEAGERTVVGFHLNP